MESFQMIAKTFQGLEEVLAQELTALGANDIEIGRRMVSFSGDKEMMYKANFCLRTAIRILKPIKNFTAKDADEVYEQIKAISWENILDVEKTFAVDAVVFSEEFRHSKFVSYKVKDAIVDYFREKFNKRPSVRINRPDVLLLDEPFAGVDKRSEAMLIQVIEQLRDEGATVLVSTHDLASLRQFADEALLLRGDILMHDTPEKVLAPENLVRAFGMEVDAGASVATAAPGAATSGTTTNSSAEGKN